MANSSPLAHLLRPQTLDEVVGQHHLIAGGKPLRRLVEQSELYSMIFWGPPGVGKTTLARILAKASQRTFIELSAVSASKADVRAVIENARKPQKLLTDSQRAPVLFLDEIHRFTKAQQDFLLPYVEDGTIILIGATTENPSFEVISPLLSRTRVYVLEELSLTDLEELARKALISLGVKKPKKAVMHEAIRQANGDARQLLTLLDHCWQTYQEVTVEHLQNIGNTLLRYDKTDEQHYDTISAYIKSMRAGDVDAALYYLARMIHGGEDAKFIARRMIIFASEDIGLAQPTALVVANAVFRAVEVIGYPEAQINLAHGTAYLAQAKKNRSAYDAYFQAKADAERLGNIPIPKKLRNAPTKLMKELDYGKDYEMYDTESLLPEKISGRKYLKQDP